MREIDPAWWRSAAYDTRPLFAYLRERDFGAIFRFLRSRGWSRSTIAAATGLSETRVREISLDRQRVTSYEVLERIAVGLHIDRGLLGIAYGTDTERSELLDDYSWLAEPDGRAAAAPDPGDPTDDVDGELERSVLGGEPPPRPAPALQGLIDVLTDYPGIGPDPAPLIGPNPLMSAERATAIAKRNYQSCRYGAVLHELPTLLVTLNALRADGAGTDGADTERADTLAAHAYHVAGSVLLKLGDPAFAALAADRSMNAAQHSGDPIAIAASARIVTHTLISTGHNERARFLAITAADELAREVPLARSRPARSVYGALLLRASVACARDDRETAYELLEDAGAMARTLGDDANERWTAFGPANVLLHRVHVALALGDAGSAIRTARQVDVGSIVLAERKASLFLDVARAYQQCGHYDKAFVALDVANRTAPEEIRSRPSAERLVTELASRAPISTKPRIRSFARNAGIAL